MIEQMSIMSIPGPILPRLPFRQRAARPRGTEEELVNYFQKEEIIYFQTNKTGAILIESDGKRFSVRPYTP